MCVSKAILSPRVARRKMIHAYLVRLFGDGVDPIFSRGS